MSLSCLRADSQRGLSLIDNKDKLSNCFIINQLVG